MVSETDRKSLVLDCMVTAAAKGLSDKKFVWYRNEREVKSSSRVWTTCLVCPTSLKKTSIACVFQFVYHDVHNKRLEIKNAGSGDGGVYMCEADFEQQNGKPIKSRQYVVLKGNLIWIINILVAAMEPWAGEYRTSDGDALFASSTH